MQINLLQHPSLAQYLMSHHTERMLILVLVSLKVTLGFICMAKKLTCFLAFQRGIALIAVAIVVSPNLILGCKVTIFF